MKKILTAVDFSDVTENVLRTSIKLAEAFESELCIIHTEPPEPEFVTYDVGPQNVRDDVARSIKKDMHAMDVIREQIKARGIEVKCLLLQGPTAKKILEEAGRFNAELLVIGSHEHGEFYKLIHGSVREDLLNHSECPVMVVPSRKK